MTGSWYVVWTKTGYEDRAVWHLNNQGFETYLPRYRRKIRHARKTSTVLRPLFPGYVFVRIDASRQRWRSINGTIGVLSLVQFGGRPAALPGQMLDVVRARENDDGVINMAPASLKRGDVVRLRDGAFVEYEAIIDEVADEKRVFLLLDLMGRTVRISTPAENLAKVS